MKYIEICLKSGQVICADVETETAETIFETPQHHGIAFRAANDMCIRILPDTIAAISVSTSDVPDKEVLK